MHGGVAARGPRREW